MVLDRISFKSLRVFSECECVRLHVCACACVCMINNDLIIIIIFIISIIVIFHTIKRKIAIIILTSGRVVMMNTGITAVSDAIPSH